MTLPPTWVAPTSVIGVDEAGYGCSAGPMVIAAFSAPTENWKLEGLRDSKKMTENAREKLFKQITTTFADRFVVLFVPVTDINAHGLGKCHRLAMAQAAETLIKRLGVPERLVFDGGTSYLSGGEGVPKADDLYQAVSAASVLAKVSRDRFVLQELHTKYPAYGFDKHKGYWSEDHKQAVVRHGVTADHRRGYKNIEEILAKESVAKLSRRA